MEDKRRVYENVQRILKKQIPYGDPKLPHDILQNAIIVWQPVFSTQNLSFQLDMVNIVSCIETKARFLKTTYEVDQKVLVEIYIRSTCPFPLSFTGVSVTINSPAFTSEFAVTTGDNVSLMFQCNETKRFEIEFMADPNDINKQIQIAGVNVIMGNKSECCFDLKFQNPTDNSQPHFVSYYPKTVNFDDIRPSNFATVVPRNSRLNVHFEHNHPALIGEWYEIKILVDNDEQHNINDFKIEANLVDEDASDVEFSLISTGSIEKMPVTLKAPEFLPVKGKVTANLYLRGHKTGMKSLEIKITYTLNRDKPVVSIKKEVIQLSFVQPFEINTKFLNVVMNDITKFYMGEEFSVMPTIECLSPWPIEIVNTAFEFMPPIRSVETKLESQMAGNTLNAKEVGAELYLVTCDKASEQPVQIGQYCVKWRREKAKEVTSSYSTILGLPCEWIPLDIKLVAPAHGSLRTPMIITYEILNRSQQLIHLDVSMEPTEAFMFAGFKQFSVSILPQSKRNIQYNLYPLLAGSVVLPKISLSIPESGSEGPALRPDQLEALLERALPTYLYIMPQVKRTVG